MSPQSALDPNGAAPLMQSLARPASVPGGGIQLRPGLSVGEELRESARRIRELERVRDQLARTLLEVQQACAVLKDAEHGQRLISAAVRDLEEMDGRLFEARTFHATIETCGTSLAS